MKNILVTGGAGYIGSHMTQLLLEQGYNPIVFDNLSTGFKKFIPSKALFFKGDLNNLKDIQKVFAKHKIDAVMHFAGSIIVTESTAQPLKYYRNNIVGSINLLEVMKEHGVKYIVFSSTAAVYGIAGDLPVKETAPINPQSPYAMTKWMIERIIEDCAKAYDLKYSILRYFNVCGSSQACDRGINIKNPTHLVPNIMRVYSGRKSYLEVFGNDYKTPDGSCIRDFIYIMDLCEAHLLALKALKNGTSSGIFNLGSGKGFSVKEVIIAAEKLLGRSLPVKLKPRRPGDVPCVVASFEKASRKLGWKPKTSLSKMLSTAWCWEKKLAQQG